MPLLVRTALAIAFLAAFAAGWHALTRGVHIQGLDIDYVWLAKGGLWLAPLGAVLVALGIVARHAFTALVGVVLVVLGGGSVWLFETTLRPVYLAQREAAQIRAQNGVYLAGAIQTLPCPLNWQLLLVADTQFRNDSGAKLVLMPNTVTQPAIELATTNFRGKLEELPDYIPPSVRSIRDACKDDATNTTYQTLLQKY